MCVFACVHRTTTWWWTMLFSVCASVETPRCLQQADKTAKSKWISPCCVKFSVAWWHGTRWESLVDWRCYHEHSTDIAAKSAKAVTCCCQAGVSIRVIITGCAVAQPCYNGNVSFLWEKWKLWPPVKSKPLNRLAHNLSGLITFTRGTFVPNLVKIRSRGTSGQRGEI